jgi:hypothetical protein
VGNPRLSSQSRHSRRAQLEDMFLVSLPEFTMPSQHKLRREGILVCNGHASPNAQPSLDGRFETQRQQLGRDFRFMGLDAIVVGSSINCRRGGSVVSRCDPLSQMSHASHRVARTGGS